MADFINTIDALGDDVVMDSIINRSITEFKDDKLTVLGARAFSGCTHLQSVNLPNVKHYNTQALSGCTALTDVSLPELVDFVENSYAQGLFYGCTALQSINLPKLTNVSGQLFTGCSKLSSIELPVAEAVGTSAFENCKALTVAAFPKVTTIAGRAFFSCTALETVDLPKVETAAKDAFTGCTALTNVSLPLLKSSNNQLFQNCTSLESISLPEHTGALNYTFMGCSALKSVNLPKATEVSNTFLGGSAVTELRLPAVTKAGNNAFRECAKLKQVDLPVCTQLLAYSLYNLGDLKAVILRSSTICSMADQTVLAGPSGPNTLVKIYVPSALVDSYKAAANWSTYANQFRNLEEWTVDNTVTGELIDDAANKHIVHFYNSDGTPLGYTIVAAGSDAVYSGADPVYPDDSSWKFKGFAPNPTNVTEDMDCYAQYQEPFALETASWATISEMSADGTAANYLNVGDTKSVHLKGTMGTISLDTTLYVYVLGINHNREVEGSGIHFGTFKDATGKDVGLCDSKIGTGSVDDGTKYFNMNHWGKYNYGGWAGCDMRYDILGSTNVAPSNYGSKPASGRMGYDATNTCTTNPVADTLMSCLPQELRSVMKPITKYTDNVAGKSNQSGDVTASLDYLPLLAEFEVAGAMSNANEAEKNYQKQYDYFADGKTKYKFAHTGVDANATLLRSPYPKINDAACIITYGGYMTITTVGVSALVAPIFMV